MPDGDISAADRSNFAWMPWVEFLDTDIQHGQGGGRTLRRIRRLSAPLEEKREFMPPSPPVIHQRIEEPEDEEQIIMSVLARLL